MSAAPWFKFFPASWRADPLLRSCSCAARGLWIDMLCFMHEAEPRGHLLINGQPIDVAQLARQCSIDVRQCDRLVAELEAKGVFSRTPDGCIFSRRMVDDTAKAERDKANGKTGGNPNIVKYLHQGRGRPGVNPQVKGRLKLTNLYPLQEEESPELSGLGSGEVVPFDAEAPFGRGAA